MSDKIKNHVISVSCYSFSISSAIFKLCIVVHKITKCSCRFFSEGIFYFCGQKHAWLSKNLCDKAFFQKCIFSFFPYIWASEIEWETNKSLFLTSCNQYWVQILWWVWKPSKRMKNLNKIIIFFNFVIFWKKHFLHWEL